LIFFFVQFQTASQTA